MKPPFTSVSGKKMGLPSWMPLVPSCAAGDEEVGDLLLLRSPKRWLEEEASGARRKRRESSPPSLCRLAGHQDRGWLLFTSALPPAGEEDGGRLGLCPYSNEEDEDEVELAYCILKPTRR